MRIPNPDQRRTAARLALPGIYADYLQMRKFALAACARSRGLRGYRVFREARNFGLDLVPPSSFHGFVVDVGANEGQFTGALLAVTTDVTVLAIEPEPETAEKFRVRHRDHDQVRLIETAVGRHPGEAVLNVTANTVFASLLPNNEDLTRQYARGAEKVRSVPVMVRTLDDLIDQPVSLLKVDVQGGERDVLLGASETLARTAAVLIELNFTPHYEGEAGFGELHDLMTSTGFRLQGLGVPRYSPVTGHMLWTDACYVHAGL